MLVLQVTDAGVRRPGYKSKLSELAALSAVWLPFTSGSAVLFDGTASFTTNASIYTVLLSLLV